jgi:hypothetical protein
VSATTEEKAYCSAIVPARIENCFLVEAARITALSDCRGD